MYEELVKRLRFKAGVEDFPDSIWDEAADAIEELACQNAKWEKAVKTVLDFIPCWIPVTERLPEIGTVVLAHGKRSATTGMFQGTDSKPQYWWWKHNTIKEVTHWMPLPEPPKEET